MKKFEYYNTVIIWDEDFEMNINKWGEQGWEIFQIEDYSPINRMLTPRKLCHFKREIIE